MYYGYGPFWGWGFGGIFGGLLSFIIVILVIGVFIRVMRGSRHHRHDHDWPHEHHASALDILKERYAKGEITKAQLEEMKRNIGAEG